MLWSGGNYCSLKLTDQVMKLLECVLDSFIREMVDIDPMQFGFVPGRGTTDTIFIIRHLQEKYIAANKPLYFTFVDLGFRPSTQENSLVGLEELGSGGVGCTCHPAHVYRCCRVCAKGQYSKEFRVGVGAHRGSVLSPLLFILVLEALSRNGVP